MARTALNVSGSMTAGTITSRLMKQTHEPEAETQPVQAS
ncbi:hypothetical protein ACT691_02555 [Vibrio metschnikovii]